MDDSKHRGTVQAWSVLGPAANIASFGSASYISLALHPTTGAPYVAYQDYSNSYKATAIAFNGSAWSTVGSAGFSAGQEYFTSLAMHPTTGAPYVAYQDFGYSYKATLMTYANNAWTTVGSPGFSAGTASQTSLAISTTGAPYVAYADFGNSYKATVMTFANNAWSTVGPSGFSAAVADYPILALHPTTGAPYVAFAEGGGSSTRTTVMTYTSANNAWSVVGSRSFSAGQAVYTSLALHPVTYAPFVAYADGGYSYKATVMTFNASASAWVTAGSPGFSAGQADYVELALHPTTGAPYVAYVDYAYSSKATLMTINGSAWSPVGSPGFSAGAVSYTSLAISTTGTPYVAFQGDTGKATVMAFA